MQKEDLIKKYYNSAITIVLNQMYLKEYLPIDELTEENLKDYNPGHLGTSMSISFLLANLYYFINSNKLNSQIVIGTGHSGVALTANQWLNGTLEKYNSKYSRDRKGLNNLITDFGTVIRSEINPQYPETIYDGGELGYSLGVAYGYAIDTDVEVIPCIIGDGEAETGTLCSAWQLNKLLKTKGKVLPIVNLNGQKMGSESYLSKFSDEELIKHFSSLGYSVEIVDAKENELTSSINEMQNAIQRSLDSEHPVIIFKSAKGFTLPTVNNVKYEDNISVHKNPLSDLDKPEKLEILKAFLKKYDTSIFEGEKLTSLFNNFEIDSPNKTVKNIKETNISNDLDGSNISKLENYLMKFLKDNNGLIFSPDELYSNKLGKLNESTIEILNENLLQATYQGYIQAGNCGFYISYEGFMPIIDSMIAQYYKFLKQKKLYNQLGDNNPLIYIMTSTCWENTYSHQNPGFVNGLLQKDDDFYTVLYPKDGNNLVKCVEYATNTKDHINVITTSKRHSKKYQTLEDANISIDTIVDCSKPDLILCATGDYMLDVATDVYNDLAGANKNIKVVYVTNPKILDESSKNALSPEVFKTYFNDGVPVIYLFTGYASAIKSLLYGRNIDCHVKGYEDEISVFGNLANNLERNGMSKDDIINLYNKIKVKTKDNK